MAQEFHVLRCYSCQTFQVQQVKKAKKWNCKMCGEKQSVFKEFGRGTGLDCRRHVQKLNARRGELEEEHVTWSLREKDEEAGQSFGDGGREVGGHDVTPCHTEPAEESRWDKYLLNTPQEGEEPEDTVYLSTSPLRDNGNVRKRKRAVGRADEGSSNEEIHHPREGKLPAMPASKSSTVQHTRISISSSSNQTRHDFARKTINTDNNQANPGFTRGTVTPEVNLTKPDVSNSGSDRVRLNKQPCSFMSSAAAPISKWAQFLPVSHPQQEDDDDDEEVEDSHLANSIVRKPLDMQKSPCSVVNIRGLGHPSELPKAASPQTLPPHHQPRPSLNSLFHTCDFDDFDDIF